MKKTATKATSKRITRKDFYALGGFENPRLYRKQLKSGVWTYWQELEG